MSSSFWDNLPSRSPIVISLQVSANHFDSGWVSNSLFSLVTTAKTLIRNCCIPGKGELQRHWGKQELAARGKDKTYFQYIAQISKVQRDLAAQQEGFKYLSFLYARRRSKGRFRAANKRVEISSEKGPSRFFLSRFPVVRPMVFFFHWCMTRCYWPDPPSGTNPSDFPLLFSSTQSDYILFTLSCNLYLPSSRSERTS